MRTKYKYKLYDGKTMKLFKKGDSTLKRYQSTYKKYLTDCIQNITNIWLFQNKYNILKKKII